MGGPKNGPVTRYRNFVNVIPININEKNKRLILEFFPLSLVLSLLFQVVCYLFFCSFFFHAKKNKQPMKDFYAKLLHKKMIFCCFFMLDLAI